MNTRVTSLLAPCDYQVAGMSKILLIDLEDFKGVRFNNDALYDSCNIDAITYLGTPFEINAPETAKYTSTLSNKNTTHTLETFVPSLGADLQADLLLASKRKYIVVFVDNTGVWHLFGYTNGASLSYSNQTAEGAGCLVTITATTPYPLFSIKPFTESAPFFNHIWVPFPDAGYTCLLHSGQSLKQYNVMVKVSIPDAIPLNADNYPVLPDDENPQAAQVRNGVAVELPDYLTEVGAYEDFGYIDGANTFEISEDCVIPPARVINLQQLLYGTSTEIMYVFEYSGFDPVDFQFQYSTDGVTWTDVPGTISSPQYVVVPNYQSTAYQYRIAYPVEGVVSNVLTYPIPLLNRIPSNGAAWSLRRLNGVSLYACKARRDDGAHYDVPFIPGSEDLDVSALLTWAGSHTVYVEKMYDQSGNARDLQQLTTTRQPRLVVAGSLVTQNGKPALLFDGANTYLEVPGSEGAFKALHSAKAFVTFVGRVGNSDSPTPQYALLDTGGSFSTNIGYYLQTINSTGTPKALFEAITNGTASVSANVNNNTFNGGFNRQVIISSLIDTANAVAANRSTLKWNVSNDMKSNSATAAVSTANATKTFKVGVANRIGTQLLNYLAGTWQESLIYLSDQAANRSAILDDTNAYFNAY